MGCAPAPCGRVSGGMSCGDGQECRSGERQRGGRGAGLDQGRAASGLGAVGRRANQRRRERAKGCGGGPGCTGRRRRCPARPAAQHPRAALTSIGSCRPPPRPARRLLRLIPAIRGPGADALRPSRRRRGAGYRGRLGGQQSAWGPCAARPSPHQSTGTERLRRRPAACERVGAAPRRRSRGSPAAAAAPPGPANPRPTRPTAAPRTWPPPPRGTPKAISPPARAARTTPRPAAAAPRPPSWCTARPRRRSTGPRPPTSRRRPRRPGLPGPAAGGGS